jgi:hypothetical protein
VSAITIFTIDANSAWVASTARGIQNTNSSTYASIEGKIPNSLTVATGMFFVVTRSGEVYLSTDTGVTFNRLGNVNQFIAGGGQVLNESSANGLGFPPNALDVPNKTLYVVDLGTHNIDKWTVGTDSSWQVYLNSSSLPVQLQGSGSNSDYVGTPISSMFLGSDGMWYIGSANNSTVSGGVTTLNAQMWSTSDLLNIPFTPLLQTDVASLGGRIYNPYYFPGFSQAKDSTGNSVYYVEVEQGTSSAPVGGGLSIFTPAIPGTSGTVTTVSPNGYRYEMLTFGNTLSAAPKLTAPAASSVAGLPQSSSAGTFALVNFSWPAVAYNNAKYEFEVAFDKAFNNIASSLNNTTFKSYASNTDTVGTTQQLLDLTFIPSNGVAAVPLSPGQTYFWRVRVDYPVFSNWSVPVQFSTVIVSDQISIVGRINPTNGATGVSVTPAITWGAVSGATGYDFKIATDAAFTAVVDSKTNVTSTVYAPATALKPNTTYFWEVRALNGTAPSDWVVSAFTTSTSTQGTTAPTGPAPTTAPAVQPTITFVVPTAPAAPITVIVPTQPAAPVSTPAYVWVIIVIGAVLVIAVIVLIARTRRV